MNLRLGKVLKLNKFLVVLKLNIWTIESECDAWETGQFRKKSKISFCSCFCVAKKSNTAPWSGECTQSQDCTLLQRPAASQDSQKRQPGSPWAYSGWCPAMPGFHNEAWEALSRMDVHDLCRYGSDLWQKLFKRISEAVKRFGRNFLVHLAESKHCVCECDRIINLNVMQTQQGSQLFATHCVESSHQGVHIK